VSPLSPNRYPPRRRSSSRPPAPPNAAGVVRELRPRKRSVPSPGMPPLRHLSSLPPPPPSVSELASIPRRDDTGRASLLPPALPRPGDPSRDPWVGRVISGRYKVVGKLGSGGMGEVYEAQHLTLGKSVALKIIRPELAKDEDLAARFAREALASARVEHPRMAMAIDYGPLPEGGAYLVLQRARGRSLLSVLRENGPLSWQQAAEVGAQVSDALAAAHNAGIVHRDMKPENLLLDLQADGGMMVWVLDLGIARIEGDPTAMAPPGAQEPLTRVGEVMGTPGYMSPEQAMGEPATPEADLFALGVILWEMVAGRRLFPGDNLPDILTVQLTEAVPILSLLRPESDVPPGYDDVVQWLLSRRADARPHKATLVRDALRSLLGPRDIEWPVPIFGKGWDPLGGDDGHSVGPRSGSMPAPRSLPPLPSAPRIPAMPPPPPAGAVSASSTGVPAPPRGVSSSSPAWAAPGASTSPPSAMTSWIPPSVLPEPARRQLPAVLLGAGVLAPLFLVATVFVLVRLFVPAVLGISPDPAAGAGSDDGTPSDVVAGPVEPEPGGDAEASAGTTAVPGDRTADPKPAGAAATTAAQASPPPIIDREELARWIETLMTSRSGSVRRNAARWLLDDARAATLPPHITAVARLEVSRGCGSRRAALEHIAELGDPRTRPSVARLARTPRDGCGPLELRDCLGCIRGDIRRTLRALD